MGKLSKKEETKIINKGKEIYNENIKYSKFTLGKDLSRKECDEQYKGSDRKRALCKEGVDIQWKKS